MLEALTATGTVQHVPLDLAAAEMLAQPGEVGADMTPLMMRFVVQLALIIIATHLGGHFLRRFLKLPGVLGELLIGIAIGPYALGQWMHLPVLGALFPTPPGAIPVSPELYAIATLASVVLLFLSGLETDFSTFLKYSVAGTLVGIGGVLFSFGLGAWCAVLFGVAQSYADPAALFLGAISTATSVGITARILSERHKMDSPEGVTTLAGAVFDDVLGVIILAVVVGMTKASETGGLAWGEVAQIAAKAFGFWIAATILGLLLARRFTQVLKRLHRTETIAALALGFALLIAGISEMAGLAMIIGAYIMGLSLSRTDLVQLIQHELEGLHNVLVPIMFCVMGMLVNVRAMQGVVFFGLVYAVLAVLAKLVGCGLPAWLYGFNLRGALRIGVGMVPRGEVALIVAGIGLSSGAIQSDAFGVAIMMTLISTVTGPLLLPRCYANPASGLRNPSHDNQSALKCIVLELHTEELADYLRNRLVETFRREEFFVYRLSPDMPTFHVRKDDIFLSLAQEGTQLLLYAREKHEHLARLFLLEEMLHVTELLKAIQLQGTNDLGSQLVLGLFAEK